MMARKSRIIPNRSRAAGWRTMREVQVSGLCQEMEVADRVQDRAAEEDRPTVAGYDRRRGIQSLSDQKPIEWPLGPQGVRVRILDDGGQGCCLRCGAEAIPQPACRAPAGCAGGVTPAQ